MPRILNRRLEILYDLARQQAECIVTCTLNFSKYELQQQVNHALQYKIICQLFDASSGCNSRDELLHTYQLQVIPPTPTDSVNIVFDQVLPLSQLKKDLRKDEIYGLITVSNPSIDPRKLKKQTNTVESRLSVGNW